MGSVAVCAAVALPLVYLVVRAAEADSRSWDLILRSRTVWLVARSLGLTLAVTVSAAVVGVALAWLVARTDLPGRRFWSVIVALPLVIPSYVGAFALLAAFGTGLSGFAGAYIALTLFTYPYVYLITGAALKGLDPALEETARSMGRSRVSVFRSVTLPMLRPSVLAGSLLVALYTLHDFGAVSLMRFPVFTQAIYLQYKGAFDRTPAAILSLMLVGLAVIVIAIEQKARGRSAYHRSGTGSARPIPLIRLGRMKGPAVAFCCVVAIAAFFGPVGTIVAWGIRGVAAGGEARLTWAALGGSLLVSALAAALSVLAAAPIAFWSARHPDRWSRVAERVAYIGYALPGLVVALAFVFFTARDLPFLYQTLTLVVIAYVVLFLPQAIGPLRASLLQVSPRIEEAGRSLGKSHRQVLRTLVAPLVSRGALTGAALVFLTAMKELPATLLLRPTGFETLATRVWTGAAAGLYSLAAGPALLLMAGCALPLYLLLRRIEVREIEFRGSVESVG